MGRRKKTPLLKRLFPYSPFLRILFVIVVMSTVYIAGYSMYHFYEIKVQEARLTEEKKHLLEMQEALQDAAAEDRIQYVLVIPEGFQHDFEEAVASGTDAPER